MNYEKRWTGWSEFLENTNRSPNSGVLECKNAQQFKHVSMSMTYYYAKDWSGWRDYFKQAKK